MHTIILKAGVMNAVIIHFYKMGQMQYYILIICFVILLGNNYMCLINLICKSQKLVYVKYKYFLGQVVKKNSVHSEWNDYLFFFLLNHCFLLDGIIIIIMAYVLEWGGSIYYSYGLLNI